MQRHTRDDQYLSSPGKSATLLWIRCFTIRDETMLEALIREAISRRELLQRLGAGAVAVSAPGLLAACGGSPKSAAAPRAARGPVRQIDQLTWLSDAITSFDSAKPSGGDAGVGLEPIVVFDASLTPVGHLAESWKAVDPVTYVYKV